MSHAFNDTSISKFKAVFQCYIILKIIQTYLNSYYFLLMIFL